MSTAPGTSFSSLLQTSLSSVLISLFPSLSFSFLSFPAIFLFLSCLCLLNSPSHIPCRTVEQIAGWGIKLQHHASHWQNCPRQFMNKLLPTSMSLIDFRNIYYGVLGPYSGLLHQNSYTEIFKHLYSQIDSYPPNLT